MILKRGGGVKYGLPYQGSKAKIMPTLSRMFPPADNFYDLFGGGFSVTHFMIENRSKSFKKFHFNELRPGIPDLVKDAIVGKYNYENFKPEWISREKFMSDKETNPYIKIIWSFGNDGESYLFGKEIEQEKRSMHMAVVFDEFDDWFKDTFKIDRWPSKNLNITGKRLILKNLCSNRIELQRLQQLQQLEQLERLQRLEQLERLQRLLSITNLDYRQVKIEPNSIVYCDIPYKGTADYGNEFNHNEFFDWASAQTEPVFVSEYNIDDKRFWLLKEIKHRSTLSGKGAGDLLVERLYGNKQARDLIAKFRCGHEF